MVTIADVRRWDAAALERSIHDLGAARDRLLDLDGEVADARPSEQDWHGAAADGARSVHDQVAERMRRLAAGATAARIALGDAADGVLAVQAEIRRTEDSAHAQGFAVGADGSVSDQRQVALAPEEVEEYQRGRVAGQTAVVDALRAALERAAAVDAALVAALQRVAGDQVDDGPTATMADAALSVTGSGAAPPKEGTPQQNADWWRGLTPEQQEHALLADPAAVGGLDGVPAAIRDEANRARLPDEIARIDAALAAATVRRDGAMDENTASTSQIEVEKLTGQRDALAAVSRTVGQPDRQLLLLDVDGHDQPRAAVAVGDLDTAQHVGVFTPGFTSTVANSLEGYDRDGIEAVIGPRTWTASGKSAFESCGFGPFYEQKDAGSVAMPRTEFAGSITDEQWPRVQQAIDGVLRKYDFSTEGLVVRNQNGIRDINAVDRATGGQFTFRSVQGRTLVRMTTGCHLPQARKTGA